jgi:molybdopterin/thiamine biosynthesis adenylyltransferase
MDISDSNQELRNFITPRDSGNCPILFDLKKKSHIDDLTRLFVENKINNVVDDYEEQQLELFEINNPALVFKEDFKGKFAQHLSFLKKDHELWQDGTWVFYPWRSTLVHVLNDKDYQEVRTARNKNLINKDEQDKFYNSTIGIAGLSVGNSIALAIVLQGGARHIKLADHDKLALTNINRIRTGAYNLGILKVEITAREIYEINPYAEIEIFPEGLSMQNIKNFFDGLDIFIDEIDNLAVKYLIRQNAQKKGIAVVMAIDNGDNGIIDIERYDKNDNIEFFHGRLGQVSYESLAALDKIGIGRMITKLAGPENVTERMQTSLVQVGKTIVSWPQLGGAALLNGTAVAYCVRKILNKQDLENNRVIISLDEKFTPLYNSEENVEKRLHMTQIFKELLNL